MNRILYASDCLDVLLDKDALPDESVDLIYLDPPFNSNSKYNLPFKGKYKSVNPVEAFDDTWTWRDQDAERLTELDSDPRTRSLADIVRFAQKVDHAGGGGHLSRPICSIWPSGCSVCAAFSSVQAVSTCTATPLPATTSSW